MMRISSIIPAFNCEAYLERAVGSLLATGYEDLEIVIVDDGSRDGTWETARRLQHDHPRQVFSHRHPGQANRGVSATRNLGMDRSSGELVCFLDADDFVHSHRFASAVPILREHPEVDGVYELAEIVFAGAEAEEQWWDNGRLFGLTKAVSPERLLSVLLAGVPWHTSGILFRRSLLKRTGLFHPQLRIAEDCHLWMRMACAGRIVSGDLSRPVSVYWRRTDSAYQPSPELRIEMIRAMSLFLKWMRRNHPADPRLAEASQQVADYAVNGLIEARRARRPELARALALKSARLLPAILSRRLFWGNFIRAAMGR